MSAPSFDLTAAATARWFITEVIEKRSDHSEVADLEKLVEYFRDMLQYMVSIGEDDQLQVSCVSRSWLPGAGGDDKVGCGLFFNGIYLTLELIVIVPMDSGVILRIETDFQGDVTGSLTDFILFSAVAEKVLANPECEFFMEMYDVKLSK